MAIRGGNYLVDFFLAVVQKAGEMLQCTLGLKFSYSILFILVITEICNISSTRNLQHFKCTSQIFGTNLIKNSLCLVISASHNIADSSQGRGLNFHLPKVSKWNTMKNSERHQHSQFAATLSGPLCGWEEGPVWPPHRNRSPEKWKVESRISQKN